MSSKLVPDYYIVYQTLLFTNRVVYESKLKELQFYKKTPHPNIITLLDFRTLENEALCSCGSFLRCQVAYEYFSRTLGEDFEKRNNNNKGYKEEEVLKVLIGALQGIEMIYKGKIKNGGFISMELMVVEGGDSIEKVKVLNPNLNTSGDFIEENEQKGNNFLRNEVCNLGVIGIRLMSMKAFDYHRTPREEMKNECFNIKNNYSKGLKTAIWDLVEPSFNEFELKSLMKALENVEKIKNLDSSNNNNNQEESFLWKALEMEDSITNTNINEESDVKKLGDISNIDLLNHEDVSKPIISLNYCSPEKKKQAIWNDLLDMDKENWGAKGFLDFQKK
jgi:hypothetical protein